jgi:hypothetical protein
MASPVVKVHLHVVVLEIKPAGTTNNIAQQVDIASA